MFFSHIAVKSLVLCDDIPKLCDSVSLEVDSSLHGIWVKIFGTNFYFLPYHDQHCLQLDRATNVVEHIMSIHLQVLLGGNISQVLQVFLYLLPNLDLGFGFNK